MRFQNRFTKNYSQIIYKSKREIEIMREAGSLVMKIFSMIEETLKPGLKTIEIDTAVENFLKKHNVKSAFKGYRDYPANVCISINEEVVHGIPSNRVLKDGDVVSIDIGINYMNMFGDAARTFIIGEGTPETRRLVECAKKTLKLATEAVKPNAKLSDISRTIEQSALKNGYNVVKKFVGHGIGFQLHEEPQVPNYYIPPDEMPDLILKPGLVLALEPMLNIGTDDVVVLEDGWTVVTADRKHSAHFEDTVAVTDDGQEVLTKL